MSRHPSPLCPLTFRPARSRAISIALYLLLAASCAAILASEIPARFFKRPYRVNSHNDTYKVLYLVDLGDRVQLIVATRVPGRSIGMPSFSESQGFRALSASAHKEYAILSS